MRARRRRLPLSDRFSTDVATATRPVHQVARIRNSPLQVDGRSNQVSLTIDSASPLASVGSAALVQNSLGAFLVAHTGQDSFTALTATVP